MGHLSILGAETTEPAIVAREQLDVAAFHASRRFAETQYGRIAYVERGAGNAALFFHGYPLNGFQWRGAIERLSSYARCIAPDFMGLGYTDVAADQDVSPKAQADMVSALLDTLSVESAHFVANDSGGAIAQLFAAHYPHRVRSLLLTTCEVHENSPPPAFLPTIAAARGGVLADRFLMRALEDNALARTSLGAFYTDPRNLTDECIEYYMRPLVGSPQRIAQFHAYTSAFLPNPLVAIERALKRCPAPARMIWGTNAPDFDIAWARWLDRTLPSSRGVRTIEGANLFFPEEMPDVIAEEAASLWKATR